MEVSVDIFNIDNADSHAAQQVCFQSYGYKVLHRRGYCTCYLQTEYEQRPIVKSIFVCNDAGTVVLPSLASSRSTALPAGTFTVMHETGQVVVLNDTDSSSEFSVLEDNVSLSHVLFLILSM